MHPVHRRSHHMYILGEIPQGLQHHRDVAYWGPPGFWHWITSQLLYPGQPTAWGSPHQPSQSRLYKTFSSVQFRSVTRLCPALCRHRVSTDCSSLSITNFQRLLKLMSIKSVMPSNHLIFYCPPLLLPSIFPSIRFFSRESVLCSRWPKYWSFSFSINPSNEHLGLIFRMDWSDLLAVQGTLKSLL